MSNGDGVRRVTGVNIGLKAIRVIEVTNGVKVAVGDDVSTKTIELSLNDARHVARCIRAAIKRVSEQ
jgi:hypothetical protein